MAAIQLKQVEKKMQIGHWEAIKFQILTYCYLRKIQVSEADLECLALLAVRGEQDLSVFCSEAAGQKIFKSPQSVRNAIGKAEEKRLVVKKVSKKHKKIQINPEMNVQTEGNLFLDFKLLALAA